MLTWGIGTAAALRGVLILLGVELVKEFEPLLLVFAAILLFSSYKLLSAGDDDDDEVWPAQCGLGARGWLAASHLSTRLGLTCLAASAATGPERRASRPCSVSKSHTPRSYNALRVPVLTPLPSPTAPPPRRTSPTTPSTSSAPASSKFRTATMAPTSSPCRMACAWPRRCSSLWQWWSCQVRGSAGPPAASAAPNGHTGPSWQGCSPLHSARTAK